MALTTVPVSLSATALTLTTAAQTNITSVGTLTGLTVSGNTALTLNTSAQPNITSVGTLTGLALTGNATITKETPVLTLTDSSASRTLLLLADDNNSAVRASGPLLLQSGGSVTALTLDASRNATFAGEVTAGSRLISLALRSGVNPQSIVRQLKGISGPNPTWEDGRLILSTQDAIGKALDDYLHEKNQRTEEDKAQLLITMDTDKE